MFDNYGGLFYDFVGSAGDSTIINYSGGHAVFQESSTAGDSMITNLSGGSTIFVGHSTGDNAQLIADAGGTVDFSLSTGSAGLGVLKAGSIAGAGTFNLGGNELFVGSNGLSTTVSGLIEDGGANGLLVKEGTDTLTLSHPGNTYTGGTFLLGGTLDLDAVGAAGTGIVLFKAPATLKIENRALSGHVFGNTVGFEIHAVLDFTGLKFHTGASARYHPGSHHLTIHSGRVTDTLTLYQFSQEGVHLHVSRDAHGGTKVTLVPTTHRAVAVLDGHDWDASLTAGDLAGGFHAAHLSDFLMTA